jgi:hypothetical protein
VLEHRHIGPVHTQDVGDHGQRQGDRELRHEVDLAIFDPVGDQSVRQRGDL